MKNKAGIQNQGHKIAAGFFGHRGQSKLKVVSENYDLNRVMALPSTTGKATLTPEQIVRASADYKRNGWVRINSDALGQPLYLAEDHGAARRVMDKGIPVLVESAIDDMRGLGPTTAKMILEAETIFGKGNDGKKEITE